MSEDFEVFKIKAEEFLASYQRSLLKLNKHDLLEIDSIIDNCVAFGLTELLIKFLILKSTYLSINNKAEIADKVINDAILLSEKYNNHRLSAASYNRAGANKWNSGSYDESLVFFNKSLDLYKELEMTYEVCVVTKNMGVAYLRKDESSLTYKYLYDAYQISLKHNFFDLQATILSWLGVLENELSNFEKGIEYVLASNKINLDQGNFKEYSINLNSIGLTYIRLKNFEQALDYLSEAEKYAEMHSNASLLADIRHNQGMVFKEKNDYDNAIIFYKKSIAIREKSGDPTKLAKSYHNLGNLYVRISKYDLALKHFMIALKIRKKSNSLKQCAITYIAIAELYLDLKESKKALYYGKKSLNIAIDFNDSKLLSAIYQFYSEYYESKKNFKRAYEFYNLMNDEYDKIFNEDSKQNIMNMEKKYEMELLQKKIKEETEQEQINASVAMAVTANHKINQPLMLLQGNIDLLKELFKSSEKMDEYQYYLEKIEESIDEIDEMLIRFRDNSGITLKNLIDNLEIYRDIEN